MKERDVLIAINEYFDITSDSHDLEKYRNVLLRNVIQSGKVEKYNFEDNTTLSIINHFSIHSDEKGDIGTQVKWFGQFIKEAYGIRAEEQDREVQKSAKELCFQKAFKLLSYLRNMKNHNGGIFSEEELKIFHKYIFYTHIGIVYVCQRVWKEHSTILSNVKNKEGKCIYNIPKCLNRELDIEIIEVRIKADGKNNEISDCRYKVGDGNEYFVNEKPNNEIHFSIQAPKYASISINFICQNEEYSDNRTINYYWWNPVLEITVKPPMTVSYTFKDITGKDDNITDSKIGELYAKFEESLERHSIAEKKVLSRLEKIEPIILQLQDFNLKDKLSAQENNQKRN